MKKILFTFLVTVNFFPLLAQISDQDLLERYWYFRNRFKHEFIKIGDDDGESLPMSMRRPDSGCNDGNNGNYQMLKWGDQTVRLGYYLGILAMEYKLLKNTNQSTSSTLNEIYYALRAVNRLDERAEAYHTQNPSNLQLNGFYMRADVPLNFYQNFEYDDPHELSRCVEADNGKRVYYEQAPDFDPSDHEETYSDGNVASLDQIHNLPPYIKFA